MMVGYRFKIVTLRIGVEAETVARKTRIEADDAFGAAIDKAQKAVNRQRLPRQVELRDGVAVLASQERGMRR